MKSSPLWNSLRRVTRSSFKAKLLAKLGIRPFSYEFVHLSIYDNGLMFSHEVLDLSKDGLIKKFSIGVFIMTSLLLAILYPTFVALPHMHVCLATRMF